MFRNNLLRKNIVGESGAPSRLQKENRRSAKFDVSKVLFPDIGKITNLYLAATSPSSGTFNPRAK